MFCGSVFKDNSGVSAVFYRTRLVCVPDDAAKLMDVIARLPGCDGQSVDAVSAYNSGKMRRRSQSGQKFTSQNVQTYGHPPRHKWTKAWENIEDPVLPLERKLCGHPSVGLSWERQLEEALLEFGWERIPNWERMFVHRKQGFFLSVFVDDIKMV